MLTESPTRRRSIPGDAPAETHVQRSAPGNHPELERSIKVLTALWLGRYWVAASAVFTAACACAYFAMHPVTYESTATIMLTDAPPLKVSETNAPWEPPSHMTRLMHLATSSEVLHGLINRHGLYRHYFIDTTDAGYYERAMTQLRGNVRVKVIDESAASISVKDSERMKAKQLADGIVEQLQAIIRRSSAQRLGMQAKLARGMVDHQEEQIAKHMARMADLRARLEPYAGNAGKEDAWQTTEFIEQLSSIGADLTSAYSALKTFARQLEMTEAMHRADALGEVIVVNRPLLDITRAPQTTIAWLMLLWAIIGATICMCALSLWALEGDNVKSLWRQVRQATLEPRG